MAHLLLPLAPMESLDIEPLVARMAARVDMGWPRRMDGIGLAVPDPADITCRSDADLRALLRRRYTVAIDPILEAFVGRFRELHGAGLAAVVLYGSRLWQSTRSDNSICDFFLLADRYGDFYPRRRDALLNRVLAPNTYQLRVGNERCKYNVVSL